MGNVLQQNLCASWDPVATQTPPPSLQLKRSGSKRATGGYVGSYGELVNFFEECHQAGHISEARRNALLRALEDIWQGTAVDSKNELFAGSMEHFAVVLPAHGIPLKDQNMSQTFCINPNSQLTAPEDEDIAALLSSLSFDCRGLRCDVQADLRLLLYGLVNPFNLLSKYLIDVGPLAAWLQAIAGQYLAKPYHNWQHAIDVYQFCYLTLTMGGCSVFLTYQDIMVLLVVAVAHDVAHPGVSNAFLVNTCAQLAITYNDKSPLENMHASVFFETLRRPGLNFLMNITMKDFQNLREKVIDCILATDMSRHFELVDRITSRVSKIETDPLTKDTKSGDKERHTQSRDDRRVLLTGYMHMADLGHTCRPWHTHRRLVRDLEEEFFSQGDQERDLAIPIMPLMDRQKDSMAVGQGFFLEKIVKPMLDPLCVILTDDLAETFQDNLTKNKLRWAELVETHGKRTAADLLPFDVHEADAQADVALAADAAG